MRSQNRGFEGCPIHLDYSQVADLSISRGFMWFQYESLSKANFWLFYNNCLVGLFSTLQEITFEIFGGFLCVRSQNRGFQGCPIHLDHCQVADMCISHCFTWLQSESLPKAIFWLFYTMCLLHALSTENVHRSTVAFWELLRKTQHTKIPLFWHLTCSHSLKTIQVT